MPGTGIGEIRIDLNKEKHMKRKIIAALAMAALLTGCGAAGETPAASYRQITAEEAKAMMDEQKEAVILDVREQSEYDSGHIPGALLLPVGSIDEESASGVIPEKDTVVLVYCRSGNRSKTASQRLADLGYTQVYEFGGIQSWPYEIQ